MIIEKIKAESMAGEEDGSNDAVLVSFLNPYSYLKLRKLSGAYNEVDFFYCDGILLSKLMRLAGKKCKRVSFDMTSLAPRVFSEAVRSQKTLYVVGGESGVPEESVKVYRGLYPGLKVIGMRHGFFSSESEREQELRRIRSCSPDIVIVGMGTPLQEKFIIDLKRVGWKGVAYTCGGFLHQTAYSGRQYYPKWMDRLHLRWLYRMIDEPKLIVRYLCNYPIFLMVFLHDVVVYHAKK